MGLFLFRSDANDNSSVSNLAANWDLRFFNEKNCFGAARHAGTNALGEASEFIGEGGGPERLVRALAEVFVLLGFPGLGINHGVGEVMAVPRRGLE
jgi:hypothetical protein